MRTLIEATPDGWWYTSLISHKPNNNRIVVFHTLPYHPAAKSSRRSDGFLDSITGESVLPPLEVDENPRSVVFSPDGKLVASCGQALRLWDVQTGEEVESIDISVYSLTFSPDGTCVAAGCKGRYADWWDSCTFHEDGSYNL